MNIILLGKLKKHTKDTVIGIFSLIIIAFIVVIGFVIIKYKPVYVVKMANAEIGYVANKEEFDSEILNKIAELNGENAEYVTIDSKIEYELILVNRDQQTNEDDVIKTINDNSTIIYKFYAVAINNEIQEYVDSFEAATELVEKIKKEYENEIDLDLKVVEKYIENGKEIVTQSTEVAQTKIENDIEAIIEDNGWVRINGVLITSKPLKDSTSYYISSRYGEVSSIRSYYSHTGLDLACASGSDITAMAKGTVVCAEYVGNLGNCVKIDHGNGLQTWYGHCSKINVKVGQEVEAGDVIAAVGSTGNSTGPHLHLEVRINGVAVNPQKYLYNK